MLQAEEPDEIFKVEIRQMLQVAATIGNQVFRGLNFARAAPRCRGLTSSRPAAPPGVPAGNASARGADSATAGRLSRWTCLRPLAARSWASALPTRSAGQQDQPTDHEVVARTPAQTHLGRVVPGRRVGVELGSASVGIGRG